MTSPQEPNSPQNPNRQPAGWQPPKPWYQKPAGLMGVAAAVIVLIAVGVLAFVISNNGDDIDASAVATTEEETTTTGEESTTTVTEGETTTSSTVEETTSTTAAETTTSTAGGSSTTALSVPPSEGSSSWEVIKNSPDLSMFRRAIEDADLIKLFEDDKAITVFAPSNDAFAALTAGVGGQAVLDDPAQLRALVLHHVSTDALSSSELFALTQIETDNGDTLLIDSAAMTVGGATIVVADVTAGSSVIHVIDQVLIP